MKEEEPSDCREGLTELIRSIGLAFGKVTHPGDARLLHVDCHEDDADVRRFYGVENWKAIPDNDLIENYAALSFLSPEGFQFLIPAFMVWSLRQLGNSDAFALDSTIYSLNPFRRGHFNEFVSSRYRKLTKPQLQCVRSFLEFICEWGEGHCDARAAKRALADYWNQQMK